MRRHAVGVTHEGIRTSVQEEDKRGWRSRKINIQPINLRGLAPL
jgi:hypothetical protein